MTINKPDNASLISFRPAIRVPDGDVISAMNSKDACARTFFGYVPGTQFTAFNGRPRVMPFIREGASN